MSPRILISAAGIFVLVLAMVFTVQATISTGPDAVLAQTDDTGDGGGGGDDGPPPEDTVTDSPPPGDGDIIDIGPILPLPDDSIGFVILFLQDAVTGSPDTTCLPGGQTVVRVSVVNPENLAALSFTLQFDSAVATLASSTLSAQVPAGWLVSENPNVAGEYTVGMIGTTAAAENGFDVVDLTLDCVGATGTQSALVFSAVTAGNIDDLEVISTGFDIWLTIVLDVVVTLQVNDAVTGSTDITCSEDGQAVVRVSVESPQNLAALAFTLKFDAAVATLAGSTLSGQIPTGWLVSENPNVAGEYTVGMIGTTASAVNGFDIVDLTLDCIGAIGAQTALEFAAITSGDTDDNELGSAGVSGSLTITDGCSTSVTAGLTALGSNLVRTWNRNDQTASWTVYDPAASALSDLTQLVEGRVYWLKINQAQSLSFCERTQQFFAGWNVFAWAPDDSAATSSAPSAEAFSNLIAGDTLVRVWHFDNETQTWRFFDPRPAFEFANTLALIVPDRVYLVSVVVDISVTLNGKQRELFAGWNSVHW